MTKVREHIVIEPSGDSVDFLRKDLDTSRVWFQHPRPAWVSTLLPAAIAEACAGSDMTYSTWRRFPLRSPDEFTIPSNEGAFLIRVFMPIGGNFAPTLWCCLTWHDARRPPVVSSERFHITGKGLQRILTDMLASPEAVDALRKLDRRPRYETWVTHDWRVLEIAPGCVDMPGWMHKVEGLTDADAAAAIAAMRAPTSDAEYFRVKALDRAKREAAKQDAADEPALAPAAQDPAFIFRSTLQEAPPAPTPAAPSADLREVSAPEEPAPKVMSREDMREARERKAKMAKATQAKVAADKKDKQAALTHAAKVVARLEREERL